MRNTFVWFALGVLLAVAAVAVYYRQQLSVPGPGGAEGPSPQQSAPEHARPETGQAPPPPAHFPVPAQEGREGQPLAGGTKEPPLPSLADSDGPVLGVLDHLFGAEKVKDYFNSANVIQRAVVTLDNVTGRQLPLRYLSVKPVGGRFHVTEKGGRIYISPRNYRRYTPYVRLVQAVDGDALVASYVRYYPLFQQVYESLGFKGYFNDRLVEVIDNLLATPDARGPVELIRPSVYYKYADPKLESLSAGQKILVRMGPDNARHVKAKLRTLRRALTRLGSQVTQ